MELYHRAQGAAVKQSFLGVALVDTTGLTTTVADDWSLSAEQTDGARSSSVVASQRCFIASLHVACVRAHFIGMACRHRRDEARISAWRGDVAGDSGGGEWGDFNAEAAENRGEPRRRMNIALRAKRIEPVSPRLSAVLRSPPR
jgi:hypothetical protein